MNLDILAFILSFLRALDLLNIAKTCRRMADVILNRNKNELIWKKQAIHHSVPWSGYSKHLVQRLLSLESPYLSHKEYIHIVDTALFCEILKYTLTNYGDTLAIYKDRIEIRCDNFVARLDILPSKHYQEDHILELRYTKRRSSLPDVFDYPDTFAYIRRLYKDEEISLLFVNTEQLLPHYIHVDTKSGSVPDVLNHYEIELRLEISSSSIKDIYNTVTAGDCKEWIFEDNYVFIGRKLRILVKLLDKKERFESGTKYYYRDETIRDLLKIFRSGLSEECRFVLSISSGVMQWNITHRNNVVDFYLNPEDNI
jgi:hypothetical protein